MTALQIDLIIAGVVLVVVFLFAGRIQEYRHRKKIKQSHSVQQGSQQNEFNDGLVEPTIRIINDDNISTFSSAQVNQETGLIKQDDDINPRFEWSVLFASNEDIQYRELTDELSKLKGLYGSVHWQLYETDSKLWIDIEKFDASQSYRYLRVIMPVSSRSGPLIETRWQEVMTVLSQFASRLKLSIKSTKDKELFDRAKQVEEFCAKVDIMIGMNVLFGENANIAMQSVKTFVQEKGLELGDDGLFHSFNTMHQELYSLGDKDQRPILNMDNDPTLVKGLTLIIDIPQINDVAEAITDAFTCANELVANFGGVVVDDNLKPLGIKQIESIKKQMDKVHQSMNEFGIIPGQPVAKKLFAM
jgi:hypothetical protein